MFTGMDILIIIGAVVAAGILWRTIKLVAKIIIVLALAWLILKAIGFNPNEEVKEFSMNEVSYIENYQI